MRKYTLKAEDSFLQFGELFTDKNGPLVNNRKIIGYDSQKTILTNFFKILKNYDSLKNTISLLNLHLTALLIGPPGVGKSMIVRQITTELNIPLLLVYADNLINQFLGKTLENIRTMLKLAEEYVKTEGPLVIFLDELDALGSERGNVNEVGEIKRAVVTLLQHLDRLLAMNIPLAFIGATNHEHLLDSAVWRRFSLHLRFDLPSQLQRESIIEYYSTLVTGSIHGDVDAKQLADDSISGGFSGADIERGFQIALYQALNDGSLTTDLLAGSLKLAGGTATHLVQSQILAGEIFQDDKEQGLPELYSSSAPISIKRRKID